MFPNDAQNNIKSYEARISDLLWPTWIHLKVHLVLSRCLDTKHPEKKKKCADIFNKQSQTSK
ncbi:hypothetical protein HanRHA438_Chr09g0376431 [Helianthus annuus]|nr:hypothetical protein HanRHA438_Chr09g0376431 [Helianthus annuus]